MVNGGVRIKVKIKSRGSGQAPPLSKQPEAPVQPVIKKKDSIIRSCIRIVVNDIRKRIRGEQKMIKIPKSDESWKDWEGQL